MSLVCSSLIRLGKLLQVQTFVFLPFSNSGLNMIVAKGDVSNVSAADVVRLERSFEDKSMGAFKIGQQ